MVNEESLEIREILMKCRGIAIIDAPDVLSQSNEMEFLLGVGYEVWQVDPRCGDSLAQPRCYPDLSQVPGPVDVLYIRGDSRDIGQLVEEASRLGVGTVWVGGSWMDPEAIRRNGFRCIADRSMKDEYIAHFMSTCSA